MSSWIFLFSLVRVRTHVLGRKFQDAIGRKNLFIRTGKDAKERKKYLLSCKGPQVLTRVFFNAAGRKRTGKAAKTFCLSPREGVNANNHIESKLFFILAYLLLCVLFVVF
jgi:hypothetical protein